jgi:hypothetical protein
LFKTPEVLAELIQDVMGYASATGMQGFTARQPLTTATPSRRQQAANAAAITGLVQGLSVIAQIETVADYTFTDRETAVYERTRLFSALDTIARRTDTIALNQWRTLRTNVTADITERSRTLAKSFIVSYPQTVPTLVVAYDHYSTVERWQQIIDRNRIVHGGFIPQGGAIELLTATAGDNWQGHGAWQ